MSVDSANSSVLVEKLELATFKSISWQQKGIFWKRAFVCFIYKGSGNELIPVFIEEDCEIPERLDLKKGHKGKLFGGRFSTNHVFFVLMNPSNNIFTRRFEEGFGLATLEAILKSASITLLNAAAAARFALPLVVAAEVVVLAAEAVAGATAATVVAGATAAGITAGITICAPLAVGAGLVIMGVELFSGSCMGTSLTLIG